MLANICLPQLFSDNAVLQRNVPVKIWGWADPGEKISVDFVQLNKTTKANKKGHWFVEFPAQKAGGPHSLRVQGKNKLTRTNLLFGEVWLCSGQSNMQMRVGESRDGDLELLLAKDPQIRILRVNNWGAQQAQKDVDGQWQKAMGQELKVSSAVAYYFGRELKRALNVPIGLIENSWGGSACEAWVPRDVLKSDPRNHSYMEMMAKKVKESQNTPEFIQYVKDFQQWQKDIIKAQKEDLPQPRMPKSPAKSYHSQHRPGNLWNARIHPLLKYKIKGVIWYQGETNTKDRSYNYRYLLSQMISAWRQHWQIGDFPFYWVQLADFGKKRDSDGYSPWAEIRESMTIAYQNTENTGQAVITDLGEDSNIHPVKKLQVAQRLVRWALANDYGFDISYRSPMYVSHEIKDNKIIIKLDQNVRPFDVREVLGFTIAGSDQKFIPAKAKIKKNTVEIWADSISHPLAVRYAWAGNPVCNVINSTDLPLTPFRTDRWKLSSE